MGTFLCNENFPYSVFFRTLSKMNGKIIDALTATNRAQAFRVVLFFILLNIFEFFLSVKILFVDKQLAVWILVALKFCILLKLKNNWNLADALKDVSERNS